MRAKPGRNTGSAYETVPSYKIERRASLLVSAVAALLDNEFSSHLATPQVEPISKLDRV
jgi:hypothetical protein